MVRLTAFVLLATALVTSSSPVLRRTAAQIENDLTTLMSSVNSLDTTIKNLSSGFAEVGPLEESSQTLINDLIAAITDAKGTAPLDLTDGQAVLTLVGQLAPKIMQTLEDLGGAVSQLEADNAILPGILTLIKDDLNDLATNTTAYESVLISIAPAQLKPTASGIASSVNAAFSTAIAIYATAT